MEQDLKQLLEDWQAMRQLTLDLLDELPEEHLSFTVGKNMGTIGKQYRHIGDVQICYGNAIKTSKIITQRSVVGTLKSCVLIGQLYSQ